MANSGMSNLNPSFWAREAERSLFVDNRAMVIANTTLRNLVAGEGDTVNKTIISYPRSSTYTPGSDITGTNLVGSKESLSIATWLASKVVIDDTEKRQSIIELGQNVAKKMMMNHNNSIDQAVFAEVSNSSWSLDDGNVGGTSGNNISLNTSNVPQVFTAAGVKLDAVDAPRQGRTAVVGSHFLQMLVLQQAGRNTILGDGANTRGIVANLFGWDILYSNNLPWSATLTMSTIPTAADTITIAGVQCQAAASGAATNAGDFSIGAQASDAIIYFVALINGSGTAAAGTYIDFSAENRFLITDKRRLVAVATSTTATFTGYGDIVVSEGLTPAADVWSLQKQNSLFCVAGAIDIIVQIPPVVEVVRTVNQFSDTVKSMVGFGKKTYADGAREMVNVKINAGTSDWS